MVGSLGEVAEPSATCLYIMKIVHGERNYVDTLQYLTLLAAVPQDLSPQDELPNNWPDEATDDELDESEPWYGNDVDRAEYYGAPSSPASTQDFNGRGGEASPESLVGCSRKRKREE